jgi:hypothetical protein
VCPSVSAQENHQPMNREPAAGCISQGADTAGLAGLSHLSRWWKWGRIRYLASMKATPYGEAWSNTHMEASLDALLAMYANP